MKTIELNRAEIAQNIIQLRKKNDLTQKELAESLSVSQKTVSNWEHSNDLPTMEMVIEMCNKYRLKVDDIIKYNVVEND